MDTSAFPLDEIFSAIKRRLWLLILCVAVITPIGLMTAISLPSKYSSTAKILIEGQQIPNELVRATVIVSAAERMALLQQRLLTRQNLLDMADRLNLFANQPGLSQTAIFNQVLSAVEIDDIKLQSGRGPSLSAAFTITYSSINPSEAARVANELVSMALEQNIENRSQRASETRLFLQNKVKELAADLVALEQTIAEFKAENESALPESLQSRRTQLNGLRSQSFNLQRELAALLERKIFLEENLKVGSLSIVDAQPLSPEEAELQQLERQLTQASAIYAASHPRVRRLNSEIGAMKTVLADRRGQAADVEGGAAEGAETGEAGLTGPEGAIRREIASIDRRSATLKSKIDDIEDRLTALTTSIAETPQVEIALIGLQRQQESLSGQYQDAVRKEAAAADGEELEINRQAERFRVLEPAQVPEAPDWPPRKLIAIGGAGGSVALGALLMLGAELRNQSVRTASQIERRLDLRPLVTVPMVRSRHDTRRRFLILAMTALLMIVAIAAILFIIDRYYLPIDLVLRSIMDSTGLSALLQGSR